MIPVLIVKLAGASLLIYFIVTYLCINVKNGPYIGIGILAVIGFIYWSRSYLYEETEFITQMQIYLDYYKNKKYKHYHYLHKNAALLSFLYSIKSDNPIYKNMVTKIISLEKRGNSLPYERIILCKDILNHGMALNLSKSSQKRLEQLLEYSSDAKIYEEPEPHNLRVSNSFYY